MSELEKVQAVRYNMEVQNSYIAQMGKLLNELDRDNVTLREYNALRQHVEEKRKIALICMDKEYTAPVVDTMTPAEERGAWKKAKQDAKPKGHYTNPNTPHIVEKKSAPHVLGHIDLDKKPANEDNSWKNAPGLN
jgi:hypothetical protein